MLVSLPLSSAFTINKCCDINIPSSNYGSVKVLWKVMVRSLTMVSIQLNLINRSVVIIDHLSLKTAPKIFTDEKFIEFYRSLN